MAAFIKRVFKDQISEKECRQKLAKDGNVTRLPRYRYLRRVLVELSPEEAEEIRAGVQFLGGTIDRKIVDWLAEGIADGLWLPAHVQLYFAVTKGEEIMVAGRHVIEAIIKVKQPVEVTLNWIAVRDEDDAVKLRELIHAFKL